MSRTPDEVRQMLAEFWSLPLEERKRIREEQLDGLDHDALLVMARLKTAFEEANDNATPDDAFLRGLDGEADAIGAAFTEFLWEFYQVPAMDMLRNGADRESVEKVFVVAIACGWELGVRYMEQIAKVQSTLD